MLFTRGGDPCKSRLSKACPQQSWSCCLDLFRHGELVQMVVGTPLGKVCPQQTWRRCRKPLAQKAGSLYCVRETRRGLSQAFGRPGGVSRKAAWAFGRPAGSPERLPGRSGRKAWGIRRGLQKRFVGVLFSGTVWRLSAGAETQMRVGRDAAPIHIWRPVRCPDLIRARSWFQLLADVSSPTPSRTSSWL